MILHSQEYETEPDTPRKERLNLSMTTIPNDGDREPSEREGTEVILLDSAPI